MTESQLSLLLLILISLSPRAADPTPYFPPPESKGGWRKLTSPSDLQSIAAIDPAKLADLRQWLLDSDKRNFAAVVIRRGYIVLEVERGNSAVTDSRRVASVSKAICATVLAIARHSDPEIDQYADCAFRVPDSLDELMPILSIVPLQLLAYYIARNAGCEIDQPRNLAKSVTVE